ncbi:MAG: hypothetical protein AB7I18_01795 [Candidatus Berkiella sp.]
MKTLTNDESSTVSGGIDLISATAITALATVGVGAIYYLAKYSPAATKEDEEAFAALLFMNSFNSYQF